MWACRILLGLVGTTLLLQGFIWSFFPEANLAMNEIITESILGINMIKSDIGGALIATGLIGVLYAIGKKEFYLPMVIIVSSYLIVRTTSFFVDGSHPTIIIGIVMEAIVLLLVILLNRLRNKTE